MSGLCSNLLCLGHVAMHPKGNQSSILIAFTFMLQVQLCTTCRRAFADSAQGVKPGRDIHVRQSELLACLLHHTKKLIRCALLWGAQPCPAPVLPCPCPVPALPCPNLSYNRLSYSTSPYLSLTSPSGSGLCHPALGRLILPCPQVTRSGVPCLPLALPATCPALLRCNSKLCVSSQTVQPASVFPTGHHSSSCTVSEASGSCADCAPGPSAVQAPASQLVGKLPTPIPSVLLLYLQQAEVVTLMQRGVPCCLHSGSSSHR